MRQATYPNESSAITIGALVPLTPPGWVEAGQQLLAGFELAADEINASGGIRGRALELVVRDTAGDATKAIAAVQELADLNVVAVAGEYHSAVAGGAATRADALRVPFLCSSAVLDTLTEQRTDWVARLAPTQSHGWRVYADFLAQRHHRVAVAVAPSVYWAAGVRVLREALGRHGCTVVELDGTLTPDALCDALCDSVATALILLVGYPDPAMSIVAAVRRDPRASHIVIGAPAGQPEFDHWAQSLGAEGAEISFLRYLPKTLSPHGARVGAALREQLGHDPSFVAFEGYDTVTVIAEMLRSYGANRARMAQAWPRIAVEGTRGRIRFSRSPGLSVWQWTWAPVQIVDRDPFAPNRFRVLHTEQEDTAAP